MKTARILSLFLILFMMASNSHAAIFISEILADPAPGISGDANHDGVSSYRDDEFVELFNSGSEAVDVSGWKITDSSRKRHVFLEETFIYPKQYFVVFGGGDPVLEDVVFQISSTGFLSLNNSGDLISLWNRQGSLVDYRKYGSEGGEDQSIVPVAYSQKEEFELHSQADPESRLFSPGGPTKEIAQNIATIPEIDTRVYFGTILLLVFGASVESRRRKIAL